MSLHAVTAKGKEKEQKNEKEVVLKKISSTLKQAIHILLLGLSIFKYNCCPLH